MNIENISSNKYSVKQTRDNYIKHVFDNNLCNTYHDLAKLISELYVNIKCTSIRKNIWFVFENHRWKRSNQSIIYEIINELINDFKDQSIQTNNITQIIGYLNNNSFIKQLISECANLLIDYKLRIN